MSHVCYDSVVLGCFYGESCHCENSRGSVHRFTLAGRATDRASCDLKVYVRDYSITFPFDAPGDPGASWCVLGCSREMFFPFFLIISKEIWHVEETHAAFALPLLDGRADPHRSDAAIGAKAEASCHRPV